MSLQMTIYRDCGFLGEDIEFRIDFDYSYQKAYISGPPEKCYDSSEDFHVNKVTMIYGGKEIDVTDQMWSVVDQDEDCLVAAREIEEGFRQDHYWEE